MEFQQIRVCKQSERVAQTHRFLRFLYLCRSLSLMEEKLLWLTM